MYRHVRHLFNTEKKTQNLDPENKNDPNYGFTRRTLDPCMFYDQDGSLLTEEQSLNHLLALDANACDDFLSSIGYPCAKKSESLEQSRQRCVDAYKKERIKS